ncbi:GFA family protein [Marinobacter caseinilyticus]|uniref:GFA family protein n=1 Tax=Marinobacter caseinilyticus TaxID=2692195 RepID=UPI0014082B6A|nr:GFA family protein [Marinobacter caseinilyticus]
MSDNGQTFPAEGACACGEVRYRLLMAPMFVHCCHCSRCQRETGSAFAINAMVEPECIKLLTGATVTTCLPSNSGKGQQVVRCGTCYTALWSHYGAAGDRVSFLRVGTLDNPDVCPPDIQIYTASKQHWVTLSTGIPVVEAYYRRSQYWPEASVLRYKRALAE